MASIKGKTKIAKLYRIGQNLELKQVWLSGQPPYALSDIVYYGAHPSAPTMTQVMKAIEKEMEV